MWRLNLSVFFLFIQKKKCLNLNLQVYNVYIFSIHLSFSIHHHIIIDRHFINKYIVIQGIKGIVILGGLIGGLGACAGIVSRGAFLIRKKNKKKKEKKEEKKDETKGQTRQMRPETKIMLEKMIKKYKGQNALFYGLGLTSGFIGTINVSAFLTSNNPIVSGISIGMGFLSFQSLFKFSKLAGKSQHAMEYTQDLLNNNQYQKEELFYQKLEIAETLDQEIGRELFN